MRPERTCLALLSALALTACPGRITMTPDAGGVEPIPDGGYAKSARANLRFKGPERLALDLSNALALPLADVCKELGQYDCAFFVHPVALGGIDPYGPGLYEAPALTGATAPLVTERVALSACVARVTLDLTQPATAFLFPSIPLDGSGRLANLDGMEVAHAITGLANRAWLREPRPEEVERFKQLARDIEASSVADPGRAWMQASCFAAFTSTEFIFY